MDNLEKFIIENKEKFDKEEPRKKVWRSIDHYFFSSKMMYWRWAAAVFLLIGFIWIINYYVQYRQDSMLADLHRIEKHYTYLIDKKKNQLNQDPDLMMDIAEDANEGIVELEKSYQQLYIDFSQSKKNKKQILQHIETNFQMRLAILDDQLYTLQQIKNMYEPSY